jgi:hypothetical protein
VPHGIEDSGGIFHWFLLKNRRKRGARVLRINIKFPGLHRLLRKERPAEVELSAHMPAEAILKMLSDNLAEHQLFRKILRSHTHARLA